MKKKIIRLTESDIHQMVKQCLKEFYWQPTRSNEDDGYYGEYYDENEDDMNYDEDPRYSGRNFDGPCDTELEEWPEEENM